MELDAQGGINYFHMGTTQFVSVPYALYSGNSAHAQNGIDSLSTNGDTLYLSNGQTFVAGGNIGGIGGGYSHYIGEEFGGGVIFHLWKDIQGVEHGLIVDKTDLSNGHIWSDVNSTLIGASAQSNWDGLSNSHAIVGQAGHTISAAALCLNSNNGGQTDWYLPSIQELSILWNNYYSVTRTLSQISGAIQVQPTDYWSSTEYDVVFPWFFNFMIGNPGYNGFGKGYGNPYVRAIRAF